MRSTVELFPTHAATAATEAHRLETYDFTLPESAIARRPAQQREQARLLVCHRNAGRLEHRTVADLPALLPADAVLVVNNSRVAPARLFGHKETGGRVECLLLTPLPLLERAAQPASRATPGNWQEAPASALLRAAKRPRPGQRILFAEDLHAVMQQEQDFGMADIVLRWQGDLHGILNRIGQLPLPPYLEREPEAEDAERYQTIYARADKTGSVAAPTAGLHLTPAIRAACLARGMDWVEATLHVGYGTFSPVRTANILEHVMHSEYVELSEDAATTIATAKQAGRPVVAIGTTSCRILEGVHRACGRVQAHAGWTDIFLYPGESLHVVDHLVTNFHLPKSTLFMLVCAVAGTTFMHHAYGQALQEGYRFYSYGDAMCIL
ncbi:tRNA preQ1(34) S-adenosylmethionine ribosyltransferase-isomerase QueA [Megalodesulfovibrio gigas]|uniref:S-adenosylmethionine:tRNA ribosyltransferase-isomerase n=1 Tax=Megalodesulfovibrio gigas (strain ATCC 19364 / DSM 1382 / NCIMB 9332 / VKM B-1759) TaxID=1121448 RepID=T2G9G3_MEGG1|nr:tRNA preQ1(34) S-adenosylmethionine ribosyltransferase-isomerase QueA [Megalodesulfovibrio gigas]AGW12761.1 putative S-adenosylmethionine--tRNA ribosyltransferase-isomerase [Megalodesulfovibrio gigas DSM 1382 = ATCC 19364]